ncbi:hypothetical protein [Cohnella nanjingensis]|uniref:hypothetical protein n=1 Tax=Cohnella nanjingensis TaxID=1387779 RepID=UPI001C873AAD|nr:hypothetical protein [Cohnella nanjingensis]
MYLEPPAFNVIIIAAELSVGHCRDVLELWCNGEPVGTSLWNPHRFEVKGKLKPGENHLELRVSNTLAILMEKPVSSGLTGQVRLLLH